MGPPRLGLIPQGQLSAARGRMVCAPTYAALQEHAVRPAPFGLDSAGAAISCPRAHDMRPYIWGPARSTSWARLVWI